MTDATTAVPTVTGSMFDHQSNEEVGALVRMFQGYLLEEFERTGHHAPGIPLATWLHTLIVYVGKTPAGFCSADFTRYAIELIYVDPRYRGHGVASQLLADLGSSCPQPMRIKSPLSPGGQALADKLGVPLSEPSESQVRDAAETLNDLHRTINDRCPHKRAGDPRRPCKRCYRAGLKRTAESMVMSYVVVARGADALRVTGWGGTRERR